MERANMKRIKRNDNRIILHFDYDCFYAQVIENEKPALKALPLGIRQKGILATCNYVARSRGVNKLMTIPEALKKCPDLVLEDGEDLTRFRDTSKRLYSLLRSFSWNNKVERLGLDEVFLDVTDVVAYNVDLLNLNSLKQSFFQLSREDPERGFHYDATVIAGCSHSDKAPGFGEPAYLSHVRILVASHLARHIRLKLEEEGYTSACGISVNKVLSKLVGNKNKPRNQTALTAYDDDALQAFMDAHNLRKVPGIGARTARLLESHVLAKDVNPDPHTMECAVSVGQVRTHPGISSRLLEKLLGGPGSEKGIGDKVWRLLHGVDDTEVKAASSVPTQIGIEDTYKGLNEPSEVERALRLIVASLIRRMFADLVEVGHEGGSGLRWVAVPKTIRLATRPYTSPGVGQPYNYGRVSRSQALPSFVFSSSATREEVVERLLKDTVLPMFRNLNPTPRGWNIGLLNVSVANMVMTGNDNGRGNGRDISVMFRRQDDALREWTAYNEVTPTLRTNKPLNEHDCLPLESYTQGSGDPLSSFVTLGSRHDQKAAEELSANVWEEEELSEEDARYGTEQCSQCGRLMPLFAFKAHQRYHDIEST
ncbi:hypothetical protein VTK73DRAFT_4797 [Phialemonium thermophilum]|uniref:UmuC domain-containing protein n=1 Tax=Phialemonium thermophilum TaxID=223376 RepID=A0ABR3XZN2_9PEZI